MSAFFQKMNQFESQHTEWNESWRNDLLRWVSGCANAEGGRLEIGRNDKGEIVGLADAPKLLEDLPNKIRDLLSILVAVNLHLTEGEAMAHDRSRCQPKPHQLPRPLLHPQQQDVAGIQGTQSVEKTSGKIIDPVSALLSLLLLPRWHPLLC